MSGKKGVGLFLIFIYILSLVPIKAYATEVDINVVGEIVFTEQPNSQAVFTNLNGKTSAYAKLEVEKNTATGNAKLWISVALYDDKNALRKVSFSERTVTNSRTIINDVGLTDISSQSGWYIKAFAWDNISTLRPFSNSASLTNTVYSIQPQTMQALQARMWDAVVMKKGQNYAYVRNSKRWIESTGNSVPYIQGTDALVPINFLGESLNSRVSLNETNQTATLYYMQNEYEYTAGSNVMNVINPNGNVVSPVQMSASAKKYGDVFYVPLSMFAQTAGFQYGIEADGVIWFSHMNMFAEISGITSTEAHNAIDNLFGNGFVADITQASYYVDGANGNDSNSGTGSLPFKTIDKARQAVRTQIANQGMNGNITVNIKGGSYYLEQPISFAEQDSGLNGYKVIYKAYQDEQPILNGGKCIQNWEAYNANVYRAYVGTSKIFHTIFENGTYGRKARYPNMQGDVNIYNNAVSYVDASNNISKTQFKFSAGNIPAISDVSQLEVSKWDGGISGQQKWFQDIHKVSAVDFSNRIVTLANSARYEIGTGTDYYVQGAMELLDAPGEFHLASDGYLYYWPINLPIANQEIIIPISGGIFNIKGSSESNIAHNISFEGLTICNTDRDSGIRSYGYDNDAILLNNAAWISFDKIKAYCIASAVCHIGGLKTGGWAQNNSFTNSKLRDIGKDAILMLGIDVSQSIQATDSLQGNSIKNRYNVVRNNEIYNLGKVTGHSYPIGISDSAYNHIANNKIYNSSRYAIALNDYKRLIYRTTINGVYVSDDNINDYIWSRFNVVEYNDVSNCFTDSQDVGALNAFNVGRNNIIRNNIVHNNTINSSWAHLIYLDNDCEDTYVYNNSLYDNHQQGAGELRSNIVVKGRYNKIFNNIAADNQSGVFIKTFPHGSPGLNYDNISQRNILYNIGNSLYTIETAVDTNATLEANKPERRFASSDYNLLYNPQLTYSVDGSAFDPALSFEEWTNYSGGKFDTHTIKNQDPLFMNRQEFDYRLRYNSLAYKQGIKNIEVSDVGLTELYPFADGSDPLDKVFVKVKDSNNSSFVSVKAGEKVQAIVNAQTLKGYKVNMSNASIQYSVDNSGIASVSTNGMITADSQGVATLTVMVTVNGVQKSTNYNILVNDDYNYQTFELRLPITSIWEVGMKRPTAASIKTQLGCYKAITGFTLSTSNAAIASIDENGFVTAVASGTATITATYSLNGNTLTNSVNITVADFVLKHSQDFESSALFPVDTIPQLSSLPYSFVNSLDFRTKYQYNSSGNKVMQFSKPVTVSASSNYLGLPFANLGINGAFAIEGYYRFSNPNSNPITIGVIGLDSTSTLRTLAPEARLTYSAVDYSTGTGKPKTLISSIDPNKYYGIRLHFYKVEGYYWYDVAVSDAIDLNSDLTATTWTNPVVIKPQYLINSVNTIYLSRIYHSPGQTASSVYIDKFKVYAQAE